MDEKDEGWDLSDLEKEIDSAVETLLVKKGDKTNPVSQSQEAHTPVEEPSIPERPSPSTPRSGRGANRRGTRSRLVRVHPSPPSPRSARPCGVRRSGLASGRESSSPCSHRWHRSRTPHGLPRSTWPYSRRRGIRRRRDVRRSPVCSCSAPRDRSFAATSGAIRTSYPTPLEASREKARDLLASLEAQELGSVRQ